MVASAKLFLRPAFGGGPFYVSREAALRAPLLDELISEQEQRVDGDVAELQVDIHGGALGLVMDHCERHMRANQQGDASTAEAKDQELVDRLDPEQLLRLTGAAHRLGLLSLLSLAVVRTARFLGDRQAGSPWLEFMTYIEPGQSLSEADRQASPKEYLFTPPEADPPDDDGDGDSSAAGTRGEQQPAPPAAKPSRPRGQAALVCMGVPEPIPEPANPTDGRSIPCRLVELLGSEAALGCAPALLSILPGPLGPFGSSLPFGLPAQRSWIETRHRRACLERLSAPSLQELKALSRTWRRRARTVLCSGAWREHERCSDEIDLGNTRHWSADERCAAARFVSDGVRRTHTQTLTLTLTLTHTQTLTLTLTLTQTLTLTLSPSRTLSLTLT